MKGGGDLEDGNQSPRNQRLMRLGVHQGGVKKVDSLELRFSAMGLY